MSFGTKTENVPELKEIGNFLVCEPITKATGAVAAKLVKLYKDFEADS